MNALTLFNSKTLFLDKRSAFFAKNIKSHYSEDRVIFFPKNRSFRTNFNDAVVRECNGLVFDYENNKLLSVPPALLLSTFKYNIANDFLSKKLYSVYKIMDGTRITMYYYKQQWRYSSARGYDVTDLVWAGDITYKNIFDSILTQKNINVDEFYNKLNKDQCYSWGFNHSDYHPFHNSSNTIWFIQSVDLVTLKTQTTEYPFSKVLKTQELILCNLGDGKLTASDLRIECEQSLENYLYPANKQNASSLFGYILRSNNTDEIGKYSNLIIESSLLWRIRKLYYDHHIKKYAAENNYDRTKYVILYNYLSGSDMFVILFPKFKKNFVALDKFFHELKKKIIRYYQNRNTDFYKLPKNQTDYQILIFSFMREIDKKIIINVDIADHEEFIKQYIVNINHIDRLYPFIY
jgi:hypothetical protein